MHHRTSSRGWLIALLAAATGTAAASEPGVVNVARESRSIAQIAAADQADRQRLPAMSVAEMGARDSARRDEALVLLREVSAPGASLEVGIHESPSVSARMR